jgi:thioredoxin 1
MSAFAVAAALFLAVVIGMQVLVRYRAQAMQGKPVPFIPGPIGKHVGSANSALLYFMSPTCGACRTWTPRLVALGKKNPDVHVVDVSTQYDVARALNVMATPSAIEIRGGKVTGYHVGGVPPEVLERFS